MDNNKPEKDGNFKAMRPKNRITGLIFGLVGILVLGYFILKTVSGVAVPEINQGMSYGFLFIVGLLTGFHCIAMCGGFVIGFTARDAQENEKATLSPVIYGLGKIVSYTVIGGIFGWLGSIIAFTPLIRGIVGITAGVLLVIYGINLMNFIPWLRRLWIKPPGFVLNWMGKKEPKKLADPSADGGAAERVNDSLRTFTGNLYSGSRHRKRPRRRQVTFYFRIGDFTGDDRVRLPDHSDFS